MKTIFTVLAALFAVSAAGVDAKAHATNKAYTASDANGTHLMWIRTPKSSLVYAARHKNADCPDRPAVVK